MSIRGTGVLFRGRRPPHLSPFARDRATPARSPPRDRGSQYARCEPAFSLHPMPRKLFQDPKKCSISKHMRAIGRTCWNGRRSAGEMRFTCWNGRRSAGEMRFGTTIGQRRRASFARFSDPGPLTRAGAGRTCWNGRRSAGECGLEPLSVSAGVRASLDFPIPGPHARGAGAYLLERPAIRRRNAVWNHYRSAPACELRWIFRSGPSRAPERQ